MAAQAGEHRSPGPVLHVAAAADLQAAMPGISAAYERATGVKMVVIYASSSSLVTQIKNGAPIDLFLGADFFYPEQVVAANLADAAAPTPYARGTLVLWARKDSLLQPLSMDSLSDNRLKRLAIPDENHAPYGRAAVAALRQMKLYDALKPRLVIAENVAQTAQFVESGNAQLGLISLSLAASEHLKAVGSYIPIPKVYPEMQQCAVVLKRSPHRAEAHAFVDWLLTPLVQQNLKNVGLDPVPFRPKQ